MKIIGKLPKILTCSFVSPGHVEFEQKGEARAKYGEALLVNLSKDLTRLRGRGFSRSNLSYMRKFYLAFPKCETVSHKLGWSQV